MTRLATWLGTRPFDGGWLRVAALIGFFLASASALEAQTLPAPWAAQDIGAPALAGHSTFASNTFSVTGGGADIFNASDQFQFIYQPMNGDGSIVALVSSLQNTNAWTKAGVMIRQDLTGGAANAMSAVTVSNGMTFQERLSAGGASGFINGFLGAAPYWVRLVRSGNTFTGYYSAAGSAWILMGSTTISMASSAYVGLAVTSHNVSALATGVFSNVTVTSAATPPPTLTSLNPTSGAVGAAVTMAGTNFGASQGASTVTFNGTAATPTSWSGTSLVVPVPGGATTGSVVVTVGGQASNAVSFTVSSPPPIPTLTSLNPTSGLVGAGVAITGTNFGTTQGTSTVRFNGTAATPAAWSATSISAPVPAGATTGMVVVTVGGQASNGLTFTVTAPPPPNLTSVNPTSGVVGAPATMAGTNFGTTQGASTITFNGAAATPTGWSATSISAPVPAGATTGMVVVTVGGQVSNGMGFTVTTSGLPAPWVSQDVGGPVLAGHATYASGTFSVTGGGVDIYNASDQFQFVYQPLNGDGSIVALVNSLQNTDAWTKAGVMIRQDLTGGAANAVSALTASNGLTFQERLTAGGATGFINGFPGAAPYWVRLVRSGNTFTGYYSATGTLWILMGSAAIPMATSVYAGLAVTSHNPSMLATGVFSNVTVSSSATPPPSLTSLSPTSGAVGAAVTMAGTNFGASQGTSTVSFNGTAATPTSWSATSISAPAPTGVTTGLVVVTVGGQGSNGITFTVTAPSPPSLTNLSPTSGVVGTAVTMTGTNFGASQGSSTVTFNGTAATPTSWSATSISALVPSGAVTGNVVVTVGGQTSNAVSFAIIQTTAVTATWNANSESNIAGYVLSYGTQTGVYTTNTDVGNVTTWHGQLTSGVGYYFAVKAYNTGLLFSAYSAEVFFTPAGGAQMVKLGAPVNQAVGASARGTPSVQTGGQEGRSQVATTTMIDPSIAAFWQLNDGVGSTAFDASGRGMNGTLVNGPAWTSGRLGGALRFDGVNAHVTTNFVENLRAWTVALWVQSPAAPSSGSGSGPVHREKNFQINWNDPDPQFRGAVALSVGGTRYGASFGLLTANTWYHLVGTYDGSTLRAYANGVLVTANSASSGSPDFEPLPLELGAHAGATSFFAGVLSGVRIYRRAISGVEVGALARLDATPPTTVTLSASSTGVAISLSWTAAVDPSSGVSLYRIYRGTASGGAKSLLAEDVATALRYRDQATTSFSTYYYAVTAVNGSGVEGLPSNEVVVMAP